MKIKNLIIALVLISSTQTMPWWGDHREYRPGLLGGIFNTAVDIAEVPVAAVDDVFEGPGYYERTYGDKYYGDGYGYNRRHYVSYKRDEDRRREDKRRENSRSNQNLRSSSDKSRNK